MQYTATYDSPLGPLTIASDGENITGLWMDGQKYYAATLGEHTSGVPLPVFERAAKWLDRYFRGKQPAMDLPLAPAGSTFRQSVWDFLREIPYGGVTTYGDLAARIAAGTGTMSAQAVGGAVGHNPISIMIPCHRVVGANGSLTGYAGGVDKKIRLLALEGADTGAFFVPARGTAL